MYGYIDYSVLFPAFLMLGIPSALAVYMIVKMISDYLNKHDICISELLIDKFSPIIKFIEYIKSKRKLSVTEKLAKEFPAVDKFVYHYGCKVTKFDTIIAIDERRQKWVCINNPDMPVWNFADIYDAKLIEEEKRFFVLMRTKRASFPELRIESYDRASAERLLKTVNNMRASVKSKSDSKPTVSATYEIAKYKSLLDSGAITQEEYDKKKNELLNL